jgi:putative FmdB family regulatory protein
MPIYEYECTNCGDKFEELTVVVMPDNQTRVCKRAPKCQGKVERTVSLTGKPQFNGPGFHATDYAGIK